MNNEQENIQKDLIGRIKAGETECYFELWKCVEKIIRIKANEFAKKTCHPNDVDDMLQEAYLILPDAIKYYDQDCGKTFLSVLSEWFLPKAFCAACYGGRTEAALKQPLNNHFSLDYSHYNDEGESNLTLLDTLVDTSSQEYFDSIEDRDFWKSVGILLRKGIGSLSNKDQRELLLWLLDNDETVTQACRENVLRGNKNNSWYHKVFNEGCRNLRTWIRGKGRVDAQKVGVNEFINHIYYAGGLNSYREHEFTSCVERIALQNYNRRNRPTTSERLDRMLRK